MVHLELEKKKADVFPIDLVFSLRTWFILKIFSLFPGLTGISLVFATLATIDSVIHTRFRLVWSYNYWRITVELVTVREYYSGESHS